jgi:hypothetical protein
MQSPALSIGDDLGFDVAVTVTKPHDCDLVGAAGAVDVRLALGRVHVAGLAADESLIDFDSPESFWKLPVCIARRMR